MDKKEEQSLLFDLYENSVQSPQDHIEIFTQIGQHRGGKFPLRLREDFCGTFLISTRWVQSHPKREALGLDLDPATLEHGVKNRLKGLTPAQKKRLKTAQKNVLSTTSPKVDIIAACNFSFCVFKTREQMKSYFKHAKDSLTSKGSIILELAGGPGFIHQTREQRSLKHPKHGKYKYYWDQQSFDPITHHGLYAIHFRMDDKTWYKNAFTYDWRLWTIPELVDIMEEVGLKPSVYWEGTDEDGEGSGEYLPSTSGDNAFSWIAFIVGSKTS